MPAEITMPQQSDTMTEGTVVKWLVKEGDKVKAGQTIAEIETDKATMEMESRDAGTLATILAPEGQKVAVGAVIAVLATGSENPAEIKKKYAGGVAAGTSKEAAVAGKGAPAKAAAAGSAAPRSAAKSAAGAPSPAATAQAQSMTTHTLQAASSGEIREPDGVGHGASRGAAAAEPRPARGGNGHRGAAGERIFASPLARRTAADRQVDLARVQGSGPRGRIVQKDVMAFAQRPGAAASRGGPAQLPPPRIGRGQSQVLPLTKMRAAIAAGLQKSKQNIPHFYVTIDADIEGIISLRARLNKDLEAEQVKLSISDFIVKAVSAALLRHPAVNAHFTGDSITRFGDVNLGIAVAIPDGLIVPVLRNVDQMNLKEIRLRSEDLIQRARGQKLKQDEMRGATFTISNLGTYGVREFSAIINPPEVAILAIAAAEKRPVVYQDHVVPRTILTLTLSADHRAVDGAVAADFLRTLKSFLEEPALMFM